MFGVHSLLVPAKLRVVALIALGLSAVAFTTLVVGAGAFFYFLHHDSRSASAEIANTEFFQLRSRFADQQPLLDMRERQVRGERESAGAVQPLHSFHTVIFDTRGRQRLVHMTVAYWFVHSLARRAGQFQWLGQLTFLDDTEFDPEAIRLSLDQIERRGIGLIVDYHHSSGGQFIAWTE